MTSENFRTIALALRDTITDTYTLLNAADAVMRVVPDLDGTSQTTVSESDRLDAAAFGSMLVMRRIFEGKLIQGIKEHRALTSAGLKDSKDSCERVRAYPIVQEALAVIAERDAEHVREVAVLKARIRSLENPWDVSDPDEPPF